MSETKHLHLLLKVSRILQSECGLVATLQDLLKEVISSLGAERGCIVLQKDDLYLPVASCRAIEAEEASEVLFSRTVIKKVLESEEAFLTLDAVMQNALDSTSIQYHTIHSILAAPLSWGGKVQGVIYLDNRVSIGVFSEVHKDLLLVISSQAASALETAALYEELQEAHRLSVGSLRETEEVEDCAAPQTIERVLYRLLSSSKELQKDELLSGGERCRVQLFGELRVNLAGQPAPAWKSKKDRELFCYLALHHGRLVHEDRLAELFWPEASKPRHSLQNAITQIRKVLGSKSLLERRHEGYALSSEIWIDLQAFRSAAEAARAASMEGDWDEALRQWGLTDSLTKGPFLEGFQADWSRVYRQEVEEEILACRAIQAEYFVQRGKYLLAIDLWKRVLKLDSCYLEAHLKLMQSYLALGRPADAVRAYQQAKEAYRRELDMEVPQSLQDLLSEI